MTDTRLPATDPTLRQGLRALPEGTLKRVSRRLADAFGRDLLISTLHDGPRLGDDDEASNEDLAALEEALPPATLSRDPGARDAASPEQPMLTAIRQAEGTAPRLPAVLLPRSADEAQSVLLEASAAGFEPGGDGARRAIGLSFAMRAAAALEGDTVVFGAGAAWDDLDRLAASAGRGLAPMALSGRFARPIDAAAAGLFPDVEVEWFRGAPVGARALLPPAAVGATDRAWLVAADEAQDLAGEITARYRPLYVETLAPVDADVLHAAGLLRAAPRGRAILRVATEGPRGVRAAAARGMAGLVRRAGGRLCARGPLPDERVLRVLAAASGAARLDLPALPAAPPPAGRLSERRMSIRGKLSDAASVWYPRDLSRSLDQAEDLIDAEARPGPAADAMGAAPQDDGWEALRAALAEALP